MRSPLLPAGSRIDQASTARFAAFAMRATALTVRTTATVLRLALRPVSLRGRAAFATGVTRRRWRRLRLRRDAWLHDGWTFGEAAIDRGQRIGRATTIEAAVTARRRHNGRVLGDAAIYWRRHIRRTATIEAAFVSRAIGARHHRAR